MSLPLARPPVRLRARLGRRDVHDPRLEARLLARLLARLRLGVRVAIPLATLTAMGLVEAAGRRWAP